MSEIDAKIEEFMIDIDEINYGEFKEDFFPKNGNEWSKHYIKLNLPLGFSSLEFIDPKYSNIKTRSIQSVILEAISNYKQSLYLFWQEAGFIVAIDSPSSSNLIHNMDLVGYMPLITPRELQSLYDKINRLEHQNQLLLMGKNLNQEENHK